MVCPKAYEQPTKRPEGLRIEDASRCPPSGVPVKFCALQTEFVLYLNDFLVLKTQENSWEIFH